MSRKAKDLTGIRFGKLVVERRGTSISGKARWWCICDCGNKTIINANSLIQHFTSSCGCTNIEKKKKYLERTRAFSLNFMKLNNV